MGDNSDKKKQIQVTYIFMRNPYMKFHNISIHGSKVQCKRKRDERTDKPEALCPHIFQSWGHEYVYILLALYNTGRLCMYLY